MPRLGDLYKGSATVTIEVGGEIVEVQYDPRKYTNKLHVEIQKETGEDSNEYVLELMERLLVGWNIEGDDGQPLPLSYDVLDSLPQGLVMRIARAVAADQTDPKAGARSRGR